MLFRFKKFYSFILASVLLILAIPFNANVSAKIIGDCIFSVGSACRPAQWLRKTHKRFQASPFDWMMKYSLDTVNHCFKTKFSDFFQSAAPTGETIGSSRVVRDNKNGIVSMHHFSKYISLEDAKKDVRAMMIRRGKKVDRILRNSNTILLICNRQKDSLGDFKRFIRNFSKMYPGRNITLINIHSDGGRSVRSRTLYSGWAEEKPKKRKTAKIKTIRNSKKTSSVKSGKKENASKNEQDNKTGATTTNKIKKINSKSTSKSKKQRKTNRKRLKIIQYSFNDASANWEGNASGWQKVMNDIELTGKNFDKNMDFKKVEF